MRLTFPRISLQHAWYALVVAASILPVLFLAPWIGYYAKDVLLERALLQEQVYHKQIEAYLSLEAERLLSVLNNKADPIAHFADGPKALQLTHFLLQRLAERDSIFNSITVYDLDARIVDSIHHPTHSPPRITTSSMAFTIAKHGRNHIGSPQQLEDQHMEFTMAVPLILHKQIVGVMVASINTLDFWQAVHLKVQHPEKTNVYLMDNRGRLLAQRVEKTIHPEGSLLTEHTIVRHLLTRKNWSSTLKLQGLSGQQVFAIGSHIPHLNWSLISEIPASKINKPIQQFILTFIAISFLILIVFGIGGVVLVRKMLKPVSDLTQATQKVQTGSYDVSLRPSPYTELQSLNDSFQHMLEAIAAREEKLQQLMLAIEHLDESIMLVDQYGVISYVNPAFEHITQYKREEVEGKHIESLLNSEHSNTSCHKLSYCLETQQEWEGRLTGYTKNGAATPLWLHISPVYHNHQITHFIAIARDMSEQEKLEANLRQSQKMESIGTLVGGIAHDFNNSLAAILGNAYLAMRLMDTDQPDLAKEKVKRIEEIVSQSSKIVAQLLAYARKAIVQKETIELTALIQETLTLAHVTIPENIHLKVSIPDEPVYIFADQTQIQQVLLNLLNNARDAVVQATHPSIELSLRTILADQTFQQRHPDCSCQQYVCISVSDNGHGINQDQLERIFDPFFTTKEVGKGTGLGLSMVHGMIKSHQGCIEVESQVSHGTCFNIYLPIVQADESQETAPQALAKDNLQQPSSATILVIDDDDDVRDTLAEVISSLGYTVLQACDGIAGLQLFEQHPEIDLILVDVVMPRMGGVEFAQHIREASNIGIVFLTGYDAETLQHYEISNHSTFCKPIKHKTLQHVIQHMLKAKHHNHKPENH